jgi:hypothetical protein
MKIILAIALFLSLAACSLYEETAPAPDAGAPDVDAGPAAAPDALDGAPHSSGGMVCDFVDAWLADRSDPSLRIWFGDLGLPPGSCLDFECPNGEPALRLCVGTGKPPIEVTCQ